MVLVSLLGILLAVDVVLQRTNEKPEFEERFALAVRFADNECPKNFYGASVFRDLQSGLYALVVKRGLTESEFKAAFKGRTPAEAGQTLSHLQSLAAMLGNNSIPYNLLKT